MALVTGRLLTEDEKRARELHALEIELEMGPDTADTMDKTVVHSTASPIHAGQLGAARRTLAAVTRTLRDLLMRVGTIERGSPQRLADRLWIVEIVVIAIVAAVGLILASTYGALFVGLIAAIYFWWHPWDG